MTDEQDQITAVLRECEGRLRLLASQGRLTAGALAAFVELSATVQRETDRRQADDRRAVARLTGDRRSVSDDAVRVVKASPATI